LGSSAILGRTSVPAAVEIRIYSWVCFVGQVGRVRAGSASGSTYASAMTSVCTGVVGTSGVGVLGLIWVNDLVDDFLDFIHVD
jgi:hypothetical protein